MKPLERDELLTRLDEKISGIEQVLKGYDGQGGLTKQVRNNTQAINKLWIVIAMIVASASGGIFGLVRFLLG